MSYDWTSDMELLLRAAVRRNSGLVESIMARGESYEDILQDLRLELLIRMRRYDQARGKVSTFIYTVVYRELLNQIKKLNRPCRSGLKRIALDNLMECEHPHEYMKDSLEDEEFVRLVHSHIAGWYGERCADEFVQAALEGRPADLPRSTKAMIRRRLKPVIEKHFKEVSS
ncbi:MAG: hypothetical protein KatS3mg023_3592 [Armatimonadota bacterium]|nr:MAG: hypothetical protein KatS3mg023_3592 [Armatimonadota bacterium]